MDSVYRVLLAVYTFISSEIILYLYDDIGLKDGLSNIFFPSEVI